MVRARIAFLALVGAGALSLTGVTGCGSDDGGGSIGAGGDSGTDGSAGTGGSTGGAGGSGGSTGGTGGTGTGGSSGSGGTAGASGSGGVAGSGGTAGASGSAGAAGADAGGADAGDADAGGAAGAAGSDAGTDAGDGGIPCSQPSNCPATGTPCITATCTNGLCGTSYVADGTALTAQTVGDCKQKQCDGAGNEKSVNDDNDVPNDNNDCTDDTCSAGTPSNPPKSSGTSCGANAVCNASGQCVGCNSPSDCSGTDTDCHVRTCVSNTCGVSNTAAGTAVTSQTAGDCKKVQCDGSGGEVSVDDDNDTPADDGNQCTGEICTAGVPSHPNASPGTACNQSSGSVCDGSGSCVAAFCGDGAVGGSEDCDDKNSDETDGCTSQCKAGVVCNASAFPGGDSFAVDPATGNCYVSYDGEQTTYAAAESACVSAGGHLVTITSAGEQTLVSSVQNQAEKPWIGATDDANDTDAVFAWVTGETWGYTNFASGQPDDDAGSGGNGECLDLDNASGQWNDTDCNYVGYTTGRICEIEVEPCGDKVLQAGEECDDGNTTSGDGCSSSCGLENAFFSEYVEGSSNNKALEIKNPFSTVFDLATNSCSIKLYFNGNVTASTIALTGSIAPGDVFVICHSLADFAASCDQTSASLSFNGDDVVELSCSSTTDVIGQIGVDPGSEWGTANTSTADNTLRRKCGITHGDSNGADVFDPATEWVGYATDTFGDLGTGTCAP